MNNAHNTKISNVAFGAWKVDPDNRQNRRSGPVKNIEGKERDDLLEKYKDIKGEKISMPGFHLGMKRRKDCDDMHVKLEDMNDKTTKAKIENAIQEASKKDTEPTESSTHPMIEITKENTEYRKMTKEECLLLKEKGMSIDQICQYYQPSYPNMKLTMLKAKISLYFKTAAKAEVIEKKKENSSEPEKHKGTDKKSHLKPTGLISEKTGYKFQLLDEILLIYNPDGDDGEKAIGVDWKDIDALIEELLEIKEIH